MDDNKFISKLRDSNINPEIIAPGLYQFISVNDRENIISLLKEINPSKFAQLKSVFLFYSTMHSINPDYIKKHPIINELYRVKAGLFTPKVVGDLVQRDPIWCNKTYDGFLRALKRDTLQIVNVLVDGDKKKMLFKSRPGGAIIFNGKELEGYNTLLMDPKTFDIYPVWISKKGGNILSTSKSLRVRFNEISFTYSIDANHFKLVLRELKKEMPNYLREKKKAYLAHYEKKLIENPKKQVQVKKRINEIFSEKKINSFSRSIGKSKSVIK